MGSPKLGEKARALIGDAGNEKFLSAGSLWEMAQLHWRARHAKAEINERAIRDWLSTATGQTSCASC